MSYNPFNHYWLVANAADPTKPWAGARGEYVLASDSTYLAWLAADSSNVATPIATEVELWTVLSQIQLGVYQGGYGVIQQNFAFSGNLALTRLYSFVSFFPSTSGLSVTLPQMNLPDSWPQGVPCLMKNSGTDDVTLKDFGGSTVHVLKAGQEYIFRKTVNTDKNGSPDLSVVVPKDSTLSPQYGGTGATTPSMGEPGGRLSLVTGDPDLPTSSQSAKTTIYYTPKTGTWAPLWDGTNTLMKNFAAELSLALSSNSGHTGYHQSGKNFDLFLYNDAGTYRLVSGPAWTNDTTRATALAFKNGFLTNNASMTARFGSSSGNTVTVAQYYGLYVGTFRATADGQTQLLLGGQSAGGTAAYLGLWNLYHQQDFVPLVADSTSGTPNYTTNTIRALTNSNGNRISFVQGVNMPFDAALTCRIQCVATGGYGEIGIGLDATNSFGTSSIGFNYNGSVAADGTVFSKLAGLPGLGFHYLQANQRGDGANANNFIVQNYMTFTARIKG